MLMTMAVDLGHVVPFMVSRDDDRLVTRKMVAVDGPRSVSLR